MSSMPSLPRIESKFSAAQLTNLLSYLESSGLSNSNFPSISVLPDFLKSVLSFVNERKRIQIEQEQFQQKLSLANTVIDNIIFAELARIDKERDLQVAAIKGDVLTKLAQIEKAYNVAIRKLEYEYDLQREDMQLRYDYLERCRILRERQNRELIKQVKAQRREISICIREIMDVAKSISRKIKSGTATIHEYDYYLLLKQFQLESISSMQAAMCQLATRVE